MDEAKTKKIKREPLHRRRLFWIVVLIIVIIISFLIHYHRKTLNVSEEPVPVVLGTVRTSDVPVYIEALGTVTPISTVTVRTQINGQLLRVLFQEGQMVKTGDLLAEIDPRPFLAQMKQYEGQLMRDRALLANAKVDLKRYQTLWRQDSVAEQTLATQQSLVAQYEGSVRTDQGLLQAVKVNLIYCQITSPISGRVGLRFVDPGNYVQTSDTNGIAVITMLDPISIIFTIPEDRVSEVVEQFSTGKKLVVNAYDRDQTSLLAIGTLITIDNQIDPTTGTVKLRAEFNNKSYKLFPNQFVNIKLLIKTLRNATIVPTAAIQYSSKGPFVYLLNKNFTVTATPVVISVTSGNDTVVTSGVTSRELVIVEGVDKLTNGARVRFSSTKKIAALQLNDALFERKKILYGMHNNLQRVFV